MNHIFQSFWNRKQACLFDVPLLWMLTANWSQNLCKLWQDISRYYKVEKLIPLCFIIVCNQTLHYDEIDGYDGYGGESIDRYNEFMTWFSFKVLVTTWLCGDFFLFLVSFVFFLLLCLWKILFWIQNPCIQTDRYSHFLKKYPSNIHYFAE